MPAEASTDSVPGLPIWPGRPPAIDATAASYLIIAIGTDPETADVARGWLAAAERRAPTHLVAVDGVESQSAPDDLITAVEAARMGVRIMVVGRQYEVLCTLAIARAHGAGTAELRCFVVDATAADTDLPVYCAHCRATHRMRTVPGGRATCPGCTRRLEVHEHHSAARGSFLASDLHARELT